MGDPEYFCNMFIRKKRNKSGVISVQVLSKSKGKNKLLKTIGSSVKEKEFEFIIGARIKNETEKIKKQLLKKSFQDGQSIELLKADGTRLIVRYADKRARKDAHNRKRGLDRIEQQMKARKLTKSHINDMGYNKYLKLTGEIKVEIDYDKFKSDNIWDGLKGYITNSKLKTDDVINNYKQL